MENQTTNASEAPKSAPQAPAPSAPQPTPPVAPAASPVSAPQKKSPWPWIVGGCLGICLIIAATIFLLGWWAVREAKKEVDFHINKYEPAAEELQENLEKFNEESEEWQKKSEELRNSIPDAETLEMDMETISE